MKNNLINLFCGVALSAGLLAGCGGGADEGGDGGPGGDSVNCDAFTNIGAVITPSSDPAAPPAMTGGALIDGTYALTAEVFYNGDDPDVTTTQRTLVITNGTLKNTESKDGGSDRVIAATFSTSGTSMTLSTVCPVATTLVFPYSATATSITLLTNDGESDGTDLETYTMP